jgi:hypothetical protein
MRTTWIVAVLAVASLGMAQEPKTDCKDKGGIPQLGPKGDYRGCTWPQNAPSGTLTVPKDCTKTEVNGEVHWECGVDGKGEVAADPAEPEQHESQAKPQGQI